MENISTRRAYKQNNLSAENRSDYIKTSMDFFTKKNNMNMLKSNNLSPIKKTEYSSVVNILKTDIIQFDNMLKKFSDILMYHRIDLKNNDLSNVNISFQKKCKDLQICVNNKNETFNKIMDNAKNLDFLFKHFRCINKDDLIYKIALEYFLDEAIIERVNDVAFLLNLRHFNEGNYFALNYKETLSKLENLKILIELLDKNQTNLQQNSVMSGLELCCESEQSVINLESEVGKVLEMKNLSEFFELKTEDTFILHVKELIVKFYDKIFFIFDDLTKLLYSNYNNGAPSSYRSIKSTDDLLGNLFCLRESMEKVLASRDFHFETILNKNIALEREYELLVTKNNLLINEIINKSELQDFELTSYLQRMDSETVVSLQNEIKELNNEVFKLKNSVFVLTEDLKYSNAKLSAFNKKLLNDSYDKLVLEQFDNMKNSFTKKLQNLSEELSKTRMDYKSSFSKLENELTITKQMKDMFMSQLVNLKRVI
jgi:hypothetical protein